MNASSPAGRTVDPHFYLKDEGSNAHATWDRGALHNIVEFSGQLHGVGSAAVCGVGTFIGKSVGKDGTLRNLSLETVLLIPDLRLNIFGFSLLQKSPNITQVLNTPDPHVVFRHPTSGLSSKYDLYDTGTGEEDFFFFKLLPLDEADFNPEQTAFLRSSTVANQKLVRTYQQSVSQRTHHVLSLDPSVPSPASIRSVFALRGDDCHH
jgi:hypothetical protein